MLSAGLGNIRLSYSDKNNDGQITASTEIIEENNYYPFGLEHKGYNSVVNGTHYPFGYNGKEENDELGLEWLDFGARNYDASLGMWMNIDPLAELMRRHSPYNYAFDNPVYFIDPDGRMPEGFENFSGSLEYYDFGDLSNENNKSKKTENGKQWQKVFEQQGESLKKLEKDIKNQQNPKTKAVGVTIDGENLEDNIGKKVSGGFFFPKETLG